MGMLDKLRQRLDSWRGGSIIQDLTPFRSRVAEIVQREEKYSKLSDELLRASAREIRSRAKDGTSLETLEVEAFALVREAARRALGLFPFEVQLVAGLALHRGYLIEMKTGEGKTLAAVFPAFLNALPDHGVHVLTFNDYLARRDAAWMGPIYQILGLQVAAVQGGMSPDQRRRAYAADVTYLTAVEAGFDLLRGGLRRLGEEPVQRPFHFALVDEADSLLIDEARVPLVIAGSRKRRPDAATRMAEVVRQLEPEVHYRTDEYRRGVNLTECGLSRVEQLLGCGSLHAEENHSILTEFNCALHAAALLERGVDYILRNEKIQLVDEFTGRAVKDRHWPDGLQVALEAKEGIAQQPEGRVLGTITLQHFFQLYPRLCGMTGTAQSAAEEFREFYGLDVVVIPPNRPCIRQDLPDLILTHQGAKRQALLAEIRKVHDTGRPILVGTLTVAESNQLAGDLREAGVACQVLNAQTDEREAQIIAEAGAPGAVTISTNMAGRGTDIRLGGAREKARDQVLSLGGLYVIGTNRHESVRVDRQLRGRAGRQGDPGSSRLYLSLEDDLVFQYGIDRLIPARSRPRKRDSPIDNPILRREFSRAQEIMEGQNFDIRRMLWRYSERIEDQRNILIARRERTLSGEGHPGFPDGPPPAWYDELQQRVGRSALLLAERQVTLWHLDHQWSEHLEQLTELREGIHLRRVGREDPLTEFVWIAEESFQRLMQNIDESVRSTLRKASITEAGIDLEKEGLKGPSSTWTYLINDDPFRNQLGIQLAGDTGVAAATALYAGPLLILWGIVNRLRRNRSSSGVGS